LLIVVCGKSSQSSVAVHFLALEWSYSEVFQMPEAGASIPPKTTLIKNTIVNHGIKTIVYHDIDTMVFWNKYYHGIVW